MSEPEQIEVQQPPQTLTLTAAGTLALKAILNDFREVQKNVKVVLDSEVKAQNLKVDEWQLDVGRGVLVFRQQPKPPVPTPKA